MALPSKQRAWGVTALVATSLLARVAGAEEIHPLAFWPTRSPALLLGSSFAQKWLDQRATQPLVKRRTRYRLYGLSGPIGVAVGGAPEAAAAPCNDQTLIPLSSQPATTPVLALAANWNAMPRRVKSGDGAPEDAAAVAKVLQARGLGQPKVRVTQVLRVDVDGDGRAEVLVSATHHAEPNTSVAAAGDYSVVILRRLVEGSLESTLLAGELYGKRTEGAAPRTFDVVGVLDGNGDGVMEVGVRGTSRQGTGIALLDLTGVTPRVVLGFYCRA